MFEELKETLKLKIKNVEWTTEEERNALTLKINNLKVAVPDISNFADGRSTYTKNPTNEVRNNRSSIFKETLLCIVPEKASFTNSEELFRLNFNLKDVLTLGKFDGQLF